MSATSALAYVPGVWDPQARVNPNEPAFYKVPTTYDEPVVIQTPKIVAVGQNTTTASGPTTNNTVVKKSTTTTPAKEKVNSTTSDTALKPVVTTNPNELTALSLAGSGGFMPSSIWQWFLVILLILAIIILARILSRPSHHEVHTVTAH